MSNARRGAPAAAPVALFILSLVVAQSIAPEVGAAQVTPASDDGHHGTVDAGGFATARLRWVRLQGGHGCVDAVSLAQMVEARLSRPVFGEAGGETDVEVAGSVGPDDSGGWRATLVLVRSQGPVGGVRELASAGESCDALTESVALVLSLMVDLPSPRTVISLPTSPAGERLDAPRVRWLGSVGLGGQVGLLPSLRFGPRLAVGMEASERVRLGVAGQYLVGDDIVRGLARVSVGLAAVGVGADLTFYRGVRTQVGFHIGADVGALVARIEGVQQPGNGADVYAAAGAGLWARWRLSETLTSVLRLGVSAPLTRYHFYLESPSVEPALLFSSGRWSFGFGVELEAG